MGISQKCQYAVRAMLELSKRYGGGPMSISDIASKQAIPPRFLEVILNEMRQGRFVDSRRGVHGGFFLIKPPGEITVGQVIRFVDGSLEPVKCLGDRPESACPRKGQCALVEFWSKARQAVESVYDSSTFQDLLERDEALGRTKAGDYCI